MALTGSHRLDNKFSWWTAFWDRIKMAALALQGEKVLIFALNYNPEKPGTPRLRLYCNQADADMCNAIQMIHDDILTKLMSAQEVAELREDQKTGA